MNYDNYYAEINYPARGYQPLRGRDNHFCEDCIFYYKGLYDKGFTKRPFPFRYVDDKGDNIITCRLDKRLDTKKINRADFDTDEDYELAKRIADPVTWANTELGWKPRWFQEEILCCTSQFKAIRAGRRVGKTESLSILILHECITNTNYEVLVVCPYVVQVEKLFDMVRDKASLSPDIQNSIDIDRRSAPQLISFNNGSRIRGFGTGGTTSSKSDKIRGQSANLIVIDEVDYIPDADLEVVMAILASNPDTKVVISSTPTGIRKKLFEFCVDKDGMWKEFWFISAESPVWNERLEAMYKQVYSPGGFNREFLAEFGDEMVGVFRGKDLQAAIKEYEYKDCKPDHVNCTYTIGVDWNKNTGTHLVVVERPKTGPVWYRVVAKKIIRKSEFTQLEAVEAILQMDTYWKPAFIYCDEGYGQTQLEMIWKLDETQPAKQYHKRVKGINMASTMHILHPILKEEIKKPAKGLMVALAADQVERRRVIFPKCEDTAVRIIPEEIAFAEIGIVQQARDFRVEKVSPTGKETYSQDYEHTLTAWMLAIMAHLLEFGDYKRMTYDTYIGHSRSLGMPSDPSAKTGMDARIPRITGDKNVDFNLTRDQFGRTLSPAEIANNIEQLRKNRKADQAARLTEAMERAHKSDPIASDNTAQVTKDPDVAGSTPQILISSSNPKPRIGRFRGKFHDPRAGGIQRRFPRGR